MKILVINSGSSSVKYQLIDMENETVKAKGICDRIGLDNAFIKHTTTGMDPVVMEKDLHNHKIAIQELIGMLTDKKYGVISGMKEIGAVGHRVVHGGERFKDAVIIDADVVNTIKECIELAPLHNTPNLIGITSCQQIMPETRMVAVFDTAFHQAMPPYSYIYAIPYDMYKKHGIRKYGFHGTSHKYVAQRAAEILGKPFDSLKLITCHLGNGSSICAIKNGQSVDTSMGFTPLAGLVMGTRSGTLDPAVITYLMEKECMSLKEVNDCLNKKSGVLGISGISSDFRDLWTAAENGEARAELAIDIFCYRVKKFIGKYVAVLNGLDALIFTAGIGENDEMVREKVCTNMDYLGIAIDVEKNKVRGKLRDISLANARVKTLIIPTNEELEIARETLKLIKKNGG
ncbi:MAG: acetate kinase [Chitinivibrionales bacterium]|nr:acetate kinase [Chitinivibrionales bacterium]